MNPETIDAKIFSIQNKGLQGKNKKLVTILLKLFFKMRQVKKISNKFTGKFNDHHKHIFLHYNRSLLNLEEGYSNLKYCNYKSFNRTLRYLYESYLVFEGLNEAREKSKKMFMEWKREIEKLDEEKVSTKKKQERDLAIKDKLHEIRRNKKREMKDNKSFRDFYAMTSDYASHPVTLGASMSERLPNGKKEREGLLVLIWLGYGILQKLENAFKGTKVKKYLQEETEDIKKEIEGLSKKPEFINA